MSSLPLGPRQVTMETSQKALGAACQRGDCSAFSDGPTFNELFVRGPWGGISNLYWGAHLSENRDVSFASARSYTNQMNLQERVRTAVSQQSLEWGKHRHRAAAPSESSNKCAQCWPGRDSLWASEENDLLGVLRQREEKNPKKKPRGGNIITSEAQGHQSDRILFTQCWCDVHWQTGISFICFKGALRKNGPPWSQTARRHGQHTTRLTGGEVPAVYTDGMEGLEKEFFTL